jgi:hypothetical protein
MTTPTPPPNDDAMSAWIDARIKTAITEMVPLLVTQTTQALLADENGLLAPLTAYMDQKVTYIEDTFPPLLAAAFKSVLPHWLTPENQEEGK